mmetsp:Transcript_81839/g.95541  ORF Transcript_81839/g.95541 Transcript_81839/m.95541 type:complete len:235 (-) Transcript_81839:1359-2063(-)
MCQRSPSSPKRSPSGGFPLIGTASSVSSESRRRSAESKRRCCEPRRGLERTSPPWMTMAKRTTPRSVQRRGTTKRRVEASDSRHASLCGSPATHLRVRSARRRSLKWTCGLRWRISGCRRQRRRSKRWNASCCCSKRLAWSAVLVALSPASMTSSPNFSRSALVLKRTCAWQICECCCFSVNSSCFKNSESATWISKRSSRIVAASSGTSLTRAAPALTRSMRRTSNRSRSESG